MKYLIENIIQQLLKIQSEKLWIGCNFDSKLNAINEHNAFLKPAKNLHSVAQIISHLTLWRCETILKIQNGKGSKTDGCDENWLTNDKLKEKGWHKIKFEYSKSLTDLVELLIQKDDNFLNEQYYDTDFKAYHKYSFVINGMIHHDIYHLGHLE